jgi:hypothetical protein
MVIEKVLILGSTYLTELSVNKLKESYDLVGYVPSVNPTNSGNIDLPVVDFNIDCDIKLSIQYDKFIKDVDNCYNIHTGLLPEYGGTNLLNYTIENKEYEQGLTFHKMTEKLDWGPIISKITYPVFSNDSAYDLFVRLMNVGPNFVLSSLNLLSTMNDEQINNCHTEEPILYKRGEFVLDNRIKEFRIIK